MATRTYAKLTNVPYQIFRYIEGAPVMLRRGRKRGSVELWRLTQEKRNGNLIVTSEGVWTRLDDAHENARLINEIASFYTTSFAEAMQRVAK